MPGNMIDQIIGDSTEEEIKVEVEEASVNLNWVKNELAEELVKLEENLHVTQYRGTPKNILGVALGKRNVEEYDGNLIGFLDNDAIMENVIIKLEAIKEEDGIFHYCNKCNGNYKGFCLKCSTLSHILNNTSPFTSSESEINTVPMDILEIRNISVRKGVFVLKTLPKNIIFGPFEGISAIKSAKGDGWKIKNRLENAENGNWMKDIAPATSASITNLDIFQLKGNLYFKTNREIMEGEELLIYYNDEEVQKLEDSQECYFIPRKQEDLPKIFACTLCCLGFKLLKCLMEHKSKCPHAERNTDIKDLELVECHCCKIWLEKHEHQEYHMGYCSQKYLRLSYLQAQPVDPNQVNVEEVEDGLNSKAVHRGFKCSQCSYETNYKANLQRHINTHKNSFQCDICKMEFTRTGNLNRHIKNKHTENGCAKGYQCSECTFQTNYKYHFQNHLNWHRDIRPFECGICVMKFIKKSSLNFHIKTKHTENVNPFKCDICKMEFAYTASLNRHIKNKHTGGDGCAKDYQCSECIYQTNEKRDYQNHLNVHRIIKPFECGICMKKFSNKGGLKRHTNYNHTKNAKDYQCSECVYQTNRKYDYQRHLNWHNGIKPFGCGICKMNFTRKYCLEKHIKNMHT